jgi:hypothetical protein
MKIKYLLGLAIVSIFQTVMPITGTNKNREGIISPKPKQTAVALIPTKNSVSNLNYDYFLL